MNRWLVFEFVEGKQGVLSRTRSKMGLKAWTRLRVELEHLTGTEPAEWSKKRCPDLRGGLYKLRTKLDDVQRRVFFWLDRSEGRIVVLFYAEEKDGRYDPPDAVESARTRMDALRLGAEKAVYYHDES